MVMFGKKLSAALLFGTMLSTTLTSSLGVNAEEFVAAAEQTEEGNEDEGELETSKITDAEGGGTLDATNKKSSKGGSVLGSIAKGVGFVGLGAAGFKGGEIGLKKTGVIEDTEKKLSDKNKELSDKNKELSDKNKELSDKNKELEDKEGKLKKRNRIVNGMTFDILEREKAGEFFKDGLSYAGMGISVTALAAIVLTIVFAVKWRLNVKVNNAKVNKGDNNDDDRKKMSNSLTFGVNVGGDNLCDGRKSLISNRGEEGLSNRAMFTVNNSNNGNNDGVVNVLDQTSVNVVPSQNNANLDHNSVHSLPIISNDVLLNTTNLGTMNNN